MKARIIIYTLFLLLTACQHKDELVLETFTKYLKEVHSNDLENHLYIMIPNGSCDGCRQIVYRNLLTTRHQKNITLILVGPVSEARTNHYLTRLKIMGVNILYDESESAKDFNLIHQKFPMSMISFIDIESGKVNYERVMTTSMSNGSVNIRKFFFNHNII